MIYAYRDNKSTNTEKRRSKIFYTLDKDDIKN